MDYEAVLAGLATNVRVIDEITAYDHMPAGPPEEPAWLPINVEVTFDSAGGQPVYGRCGDSVRVTGAVVVKRTDDVAASARLLQYLRGSGSTSVKTALEADPTLGGACNDLTVVTGRTPRVLPLAGTEFWGVEFVVEIDGDGS